MLFARKNGVLPHFSIGTFEKLGVRIKKLEKNNPNLEFMRTLNTQLKSSKKQLK